jgi:hypothetical protein
MSNVLSSKLECLSLKGIFKGPNKYLWVPQSLGQAVSLTHL